MNIPLILSAFFVGNILGTYIKDVKNNLPSFFSKSSVDIPEAPPLILPIAENIPLNSTKQTNQINFKNNFVTSSFGVFKILKSSSFYQSNYF